MQRSLEPFIKQDLVNKLVLLSGPRQVGKTTLSQQLGGTTSYLNYDARAHRKILLSQTWDRSCETVVFDELHKMRRWKSWLKGVFDTEKRPPAILVTGSAKLDVYRKGGDSLAGRHFVYRLHPLTVKEVSSFLSSEEALKRLIDVGGFPEPFLKADPVFAKRWRRRHLDVVLRQDLMDIQPVRDIKSVEVLVEILRERVGTPVSYASLAEDLQVSINTVKHWLEVLENLFVIFPVRPYHRNVARSLLKEPKYYFYDTGAVEGDSGAKLENVVACAFQAELQFHEDTTGARVALHYLRDKEKREVDFLAVVDGKPRRLVEVKWSDDSLAPSLFHFKKFFKDILIHQVVHTVRYRKSREGIRLQPAHEYLSQLSFQSDPSG